MTTEVRFDDFGEEQPNTRAPEGEEDTLEIILAQARGRARAEGFSDGIASAEAESARERSQMLASILEAFRDTDLICRDMGRQQTNAIADAAIALCDSVMPALVDQRVKAEIGFSLDKALQDHPQEAVTVYVPADHLAEIQNHLAPTLPRVVVAPDPGLLQGAARVHWPFGLDQIDIAKFVREAAEILRVHLDADRLSAEAPYLRRLADE